MDIATLLQTLATEATKVVQNGEVEWYAASKDLEDFKELKANLEEKRDWWMEAIRRNGLAQEKIVREPLANAITCLKHESEKLEDLQNNGCLSFMYKSSRAFQIPCLSFIFKARVFPIPLKESMDKVVRAFDKIHDGIRGRQESGLMFEEIADELPEPAQFTLDKEIMHLSETEALVKRHLEDLQGKQVVTLYGGFGSGKTCLAKSLVQQYGKKPNSSELDSSTTTFSDGVKFLPCGPNAESGSICKKLLEDLGFNMSVESKEDKKGDLKKNLNPNGNVDSSHFKKLRRGLLDLNLLIILDDVHDAKLVRDLRVLDAKNVKYLITSWKRDICPGASEVHMRRPTQEEARQILGNYVPNLPNGTIPTDVQDVADKIILEADSLPVVLATIGRQIEYNIEDDSSWSNVFDGFYEYLSIQQNDDDDDDDDQERQVFGHVRYNNVNASMLMAIKGLPYDAQNLLFCMSLCEAHFLPEPLLELFFKHINESKYFPGAFKTQLKHLKDRDFIFDSEAIVTNFEPNIEVKLGRRWTLSGSLRYIILKEYKDEVSKMLCTLMSNNTSSADYASEESILVKALCVLFANPKKDVFTKEASKLLVDVENSFNFPIKQPNNIVKLKDTMLAFIYFLLPSRRGEAWKIRRHDLSSKVIIRFIFHLDLDDQSCSQLLEEKDTFIEVCAALVYMSENWEAPILTVHTRHTLERLANIFALNCSPDLKIVSLWALSNLSRSTSCDLILDNSIVFQAVCKAILHANDSDIKNQSFAIECLGSLAQSSSARIKIANVEGVIDTLVNVLDGDQLVDERQLKTRAVYALGLIAFQKETSFKVASTTNLISVLAKLLEATSIKREIFWEPIYLLDCLSSLVGTNEETKALISTHSELVPTLEKFLHNDVDDDMQSKAIYVLTCLDHVKYNNITLHSIAAKTSRGFANLNLKLYQEALADFESADFDDPNNDDYYKMNKCFAKTKLRDYEGALLCANRAVEGDQNNPMVWQERGVLNELMEKYEDALEDLNRACMLDIEPDDYEVLKHRAFVNFKLGRNNEAHEDAKKALQSPGHYSIQDPDYGDYCLGSLSVPQFLGYNLV